MARPRAFDEKKAIDAATEEFWRHGYAAASTRDLAERMGMCAPSLYNAFGDKRALFIRALEHYATQTTRARLARLEATYDGGARVRAYFDEAIAKMLDDPERRGCLIINTALEVAPHDKEIAVAVTTYLGEVRAFFERAIRAAQARGETPPAISDAEAAGTLLGIMLGMRVLGRTVQDRATFEAMLAPVFTLLQIPLTNPEGR